MIPELYSMNHLEYQNNKIHLKKYWVVVLSALEETVAELFCKNNYSRRQVKAVAPIELKHEQWDPEANVSQYTNFRRNLRRKVSSNVNVPPIVLERFSYCCAAWIGHFGWRYEESCW